jgi:hypothetical protein
MANDGEGEMSCLAVNTELTGFLEYDLVAAVTNGTIPLGIARDPDLTDLVCTRVARNLTSAEWTRFVGRTIPDEQSCLIFQLVRARSATSSRAPRMLSPSGT